MELGEVHLAEAAGLDEAACYGVAHGEGGRGGGGGGEVEGVSLTLYGDIEMGIGVLGKQRVGVAAHADDGDAALIERRNEAQQLVGIAGVADGYDDIALHDDAEIAMVEVEGIDIEAGSAGAAEGGSYLGTDMTALAHTGDDDLALAGEDEVDGLIEIFVELGDEVEQGLSLVLKTLDCG